MRYHHDDVEYKNEDSSIECLDSPVIKDNPFNFSIQNELKETNEFRLEDLNEEEKQSLKKVLFEFRDIQYRESDNLTFTSTIKHVIQTRNENPVYKKPYKYPQAYDQEVDTQIKDMIKQGIIRKSKSPYCSPIWIVPKKSDASGIKKFRIVIDYRSLNEVTIDDKYPIPIMDDILDKLGKCQYFTTIDLVKGFHQIQMDKNSIPKTAFSTALRVYSNAVWFEECACYISEVHEQSLRGFGLQGLFSLHG